MTAVTLTNEEELCVAYRKCNDTTEQKIEKKLLGNNQDQRLKWKKINTCLKVGHGNDARMVNVDLAKYIVSLRLYFGDKPSVGSGVIINIIDNIVYILTAGHNIMTLNPRQYKATKAKCIKCKINGKWYESDEFYAYDKYNLGNINDHDKHDMAVIKVVINEDFMFYNVFPKLVSFENNTGYHDCINNNECFIAGYPAEKRGGLYGMNGTYRYIKNNIYNNDTICYDDIDTTGGQSGSPIFVNNNNIVGVHIRAGENGNKANYGCPLNDKKIKWIHDIMKMKRCYDDQKYDININYNDDNNDANSLQYTVKTINNTACFFEMLSSYSISWFETNNLIVDENSTKTLKSCQHMFYDVILNKNAVLTTDKYNNSFWSPYGGHLTLKIKNKLILRDDAKIDLNQLQSYSRGGTLTIFAFSIIIHKNAGIFSNGITDTSKWGGDIQIHCDTFCNHGMIHSKPLGYVDLCCKNITKRGNIEPSDVQVIGIFRLPK